jgi:Tol biopolymer transport system component
MTKIYFPIYLLFLFSFLSLHAQDENFLYPDPVLPDSVPRVFAPEFISLEGLHEEGICFSPSLDEIFFTSISENDKGEKVSTIMWLTRNGNTWSPIKKAPFTSKSNESEPAFSDAGDHLFFFSERRKPGITPYIGEIWQTHKLNGKWGNPVYKENILNETWINSVTTTAGGYIFFSSFRNKNMGIFYSEKVNGEYQEPVYLPNEVNSVAGATNPFISRDGNTLVFEGQSTGYGNTDLYISFRTSTGLWTPAIKLNENINKTKTETNPSLSPDGKYLFFTREGDLYWVRIEYVF